MYNLISTSLREGVGSWSHIGRQIKANKGMGVW